MYVKLNSWYMYMRGMCIYVVCVFVGYVYLCGMCICVVCVFVWYAHLCGMCICVVCVFVWYVYLCGMCICVVCVYVCIQSPSRPVLMHAYTLFFVRRSNARSARLSAGQHLIAL